MRLLSLTEWDNIEYHPAERKKETKKERGGEKDEETNKG